MELYNCRHHGETKAYRRTRGDYYCGKCNVEAVMKRRRDVKLKAVEYKGGKCVHCGYGKCVDALHFHHLDPAEKDFAISRNGHSRSWTRVKAEVDKCELVCANCHAELHAKEYQ